jgi:hypothetical protein
MMQQPKAQASDITESTGGDAVEPAVNPLPTTGTIEYTTNIEDKLFLGLPWKISQQKD